MVFREYLTGFSKRKKEKQAAAQAKALEKEKVEKLELRQQVRIPSLIPPSA